jgi:hypothetical protein
MTFPRSKPGKVEIIDDHTVKDGDLIPSGQSVSNTPGDPFQRGRQTDGGNPGYEPESRSCWA